MNWIEIAIFVGYSVAITLLIIAVILLAIRNKRLLRSVAQLSIDKMALYAQLDELAAYKEEKSLEQSDGFIKFISDSRQWAFDYIDNVQSAIDEYRKIADVVPISKDMSVAQAEELSAAYDKLMSFLPEENLVQ